MMGESRWLIIFVAAMIIEGGSVDYNPLAYW